MRGVKIAILLVLTAISGRLYGQSGKIGGVVADEVSGKPIAGVMVSIPKNDIYTITDSLGIFTIDNAPLGYHTLNFNFYGYEEFLSEPQHITAATSNRLEILLSPLSINLDDITVKGRSVRRDEAPPVSVHKLSKWAIEKSPGGSRDILRSVQNLPGVVQTSSDRNDLIVRGGGPNENKFYLDQIEIPVLNHFQTQGASGGNLSLINSDILSGATFYSSAFPASRGGSLSSVLDLKMKEGNFDEFKVRLAAGTSDAAVVIDTPITDKWSVIASYRISYLQLLFGMLDLPFLPTYQDMQFKSVYNFDERNKLTVLGVGAFDINRLNTSVKDLTPDREQILNYLPENDQWNYAIGALYSHITDKGVLDFVISTDKLDNRFNKWRNNDESDIKTFDYTSTERAIRSRLQYNQRLSTKLIFSGGISANNMRYFIDNNQVSFVDGDAEYESYQSSLSTTSYALYTTLDGSFAQKSIDMTLSARIDGNDYSSEMSNPLDQFSPRLSMSWRFAPKLSLNWNVGRYYQEPGYGAMAYRNDQGVLANRDRLDYISSNQATIGLAYRPRVGHELVTELFWKDYRNYPMSMVDSTAMGSNIGDAYVVGNEPYASVGKARAYGVEVGYRNDNLWGNMVSLSYTYYHSQYRKLDSNFEPTGAYTSTSWDYRHQFNIMASRDLGKGWSIGAKWRISGGEPTTPYDYSTSSLIDVWDTNQQAVYDYTLLNSQRLTPFHQLDVRVDKEWYFPKWTLSLYVDIQNLYNYECADNGLLLPQTSSDGSYMIDPSDASRYLLYYYPTTDGGTIIPAIGIVIDF